MEIVLLKCMLLFNCTIYLDKKTDSIGENTQSQLHAKTKKSLSLKEKCKMGRSQRWMAQHVSDAYVQRARKEGLVSRSTFKLAEVLKRTRGRLTPRSLAHAAVVDIGASPGGWTQHLLRLPPAQRPALVLAVDPIPLDSRVVAEAQQQQLEEAQNDDHSSNDQTTQSGEEGQEGAAAVKRQRRRACELVYLSSIVQPEVEANAALVAQLQREAAVRQRRVALVVSDAAPNTSGQRQRDALAASRLVCAVVRVAHALGAPALVAKFRRGGGDDEAEREIRAELAAAGYAHVSLFKPPSSRKQSAEMYVIAKQ